MAEAVSVGEGDMERDAERVADNVYVEVGVGDRVQESIHDTDNVLEAEAEALRETVTVREGEGEEESVDVRGGEGEGELETEGDGDNVRERETVKE